MQLEKRKEPLVEIKAVELFQSRAVTDNAVFAEKLKG